MKSFLLITLTFILIISMFAPSFSDSSNKEVILAATTSVCDTGLMDILGKAFQEKTGYILKTIPVGTGEALTMASKGEADVVIVHNEKAEKEFIEKGYGLSKEKIMHNFFVIIGPLKDPVKIKSAANSLEAFKKIEKTKYIFVSRGDDSGTNKKEMELWNKLGITPKGDWYIESGQGMSQTIFIANEKEAYTLTDTGTFLSLKKQVQLVILLDADPDLINIYSAIQVNPEKFPSVNKDGARAFVDFLLSREAQNLIKNFGTKEFGAPLFIPDRLDSK